MFTDSFKTTDDRNFSTRSGKSKTDFQHPKMSKVRLNSTSFVFYIVLMKPIRSYPLYALSIHSNFWYSDT